ncbi:hypothetical protein [Bradyrhizobium sp. S3.7.6]
MADDDEPQNPNEQDQQRLMKPRDNVIPFPVIERLAPTAAITDLMIGRYLLINREPVLCRDLMTWVQQFETRATLKKETGTDPWRVALTDLGDDVYVSTVFLGLDHSFGRGRAVLFETMIFRRGTGIEMPSGTQLPEDLFGYKERCCTWDEAEAMHERAVQFARAEINKVGTHG